MSKLKWRDEYSVGDPEIDRQHRDLFALIDRLEDHDLDADAMASTFEELDIYVNVHFAAEENLLKAVKYPDYDAHLRLHEEFKDWLNTAKSSFTAHSEDQIFSIGQNLQVFLKDWLLSHIVTADQAYKKYIQEVG